MGVKHLRVDGDRKYAKTDAGYEILVTGMSEGEMLARGVIFDDDGAAAAEESEGPSARIVDEDRDGEVFATGSPGDEQDDDADGGDDQGDVEYPVHKGGGVWELSDGSTTDKMKRAAAEELEAALHADGDTENDAGDGDGDEDEES